MQVPHHRRRYAARVAVGVAEVEQHRTPFPAFLLFFLSLTASASVPSRITLLAAAAAMVVGPGM
jgi:hypothetical protein